MKPVTLPPGCARLSTKSAPTGSGVIANTTGMVRGQPQQRCQAHDPRSQNELWRERDEFRRPFARIVGIGGAVSNIQPHVAPLDPARLLQPLPKGRAALVCLGIVSRLVHKHADPSHALALLRARRERPHGSRAAKQRDELTPFHSITSSARASSVGGISRPRALAVTRLMTRSNLVGCSTGRSPGFAPRSILSTYSAARRFRSGKFGP